MFNKIVKSKELTNLDFLFTERTIEKFLYCILEMFTRNIRALFACKNFADGDKMDF